MLIPYLGEKSKLAGFITPYIPKNISTYVEPFGGMAGVFFSLDFSKYRDVEFIYNDKNYLNWLLFNKLRNDHNFFEIIKSTNVDKDFYQNCLQNLFTEKDENKLALYWLTILTCSSPYEIGKQSWRSAIEFEVFKLKFKAYKYHLERLSSILNLDYTEIIDKYDSPSTFFYLDPPYFGKESYYINHDFNSDSHRALSEKLLSIKGKFILSYYYFDGIEDLYTGCKFEKKVTIMGTEYIIMNY
jgi:DNA adenine methylase